jgi:hypothetical protein
MELYKMGIWRVDVMMNGFFSLRTLSNVGSMGGEEFPKSVCISFSINIKIHGVSTIHIYNKRED